MKDELDRSIKQDLNLYVEGWGNLGLASQYTNSFKIFKEYYKVWISMHGQIVNSKNCIPIKDYLKKEEVSLKIILPSLVNQIV